MIEHYAGRNAEPGLELFSGVLGHHLSKQEVTVNPSSPTPCGATSSLTDADRHAIARARELASLRTTAALTERFPGWNDTAATYA